MSTSSFPPSFASFPDLDPEPSHSSHGPSNPENDKKLGVKDKLKKRKRTRSDSEGHGKVKIERDHVVVADLPSSSFSDRKGDPLNIRYGGLHTRDVPKYHIVGQIY